MPALIVRLPKNRDFCGEIFLIGASGAVLAGPYRIAGRANDAAAAAAGNAARTSILRYGDTPTGTYKISTILSSGAGTAFAQGSYGSGGVLVLDPCDGNAALAEANGRFHLFIQGGEMSGGQLCATNGALRMADDELAVLCRLLADAVGTECWCTEDAALAAGEAVMVDWVYDEGDPAPLIKRRAGLDVSRRNLLTRGAAMVAAFPPVATVLLPGIFVAAASPSLAFAKNAYDSDQNDHDFTSAKAY
jgi:hypothetical protein